MLGAGASVDYGLPTWEKLNNLIKDTIENDKINQYEYKKEILEWLNKVGDNKLYKTIDECIKSESRLQDYHDNGDKIENEIFRVISEIFGKMYKNSDVGWIKLLNNKIKNNEHMELENKIAFINYNYDNVLDTNFLNFGSLCSKDKLFYEKRLGQLSNVKIRCLYPHGFFSEFEPNNLYRETDTYKTNKKEYLNAVSCYDSLTHRIELENLAKDITLYILGLGGGLEINLNNINFGNNISKIHITIKNKQKIDDIENFLINKFKIDPTEIKVYEDCNDLINNCFN
ncbi:MAG TPA: hypothetical protein DEB09_03920 [Candidatus Magasanikbacteria bacterium]|nr:hypothetical protein [Candidatus Magasanikbacteria bacterium]